MYNYTCLNPIAGVGLDLLSDDYKKVEELKDAQAVLVRSAAMHDLELPKDLCAVARAGAGVNNIPALCNAGISVLSIILCNSSIFTLNGFVGIPFLILNLCGKLPINLGVPSGSGYAEFSYSDILFFFQFTHLGNI